MIKGLGIAYWLCLLLLFGCKNTTTKNESHQPHCVKIESLPVKYAGGFSIDYYEGFKVATVRDWRDTAKMFFQYVIMDDRKQLPVDFAQAVLIDTPAQRVICISTTHIAEMKRLGLQHLIAGIPNVNLVYDEEVHSLVDQQKIADLGGDELNYEKLVELNPSFVFTSGSYDGGDKVKAKLEALHIKSVLNLDYLEQDPLARAEWLKFVGAFFDMEAEADSIFKEIESNYTQLREKVKNASPQPTVFCNMPFKEVWYMPSGETYIARLFADAGGNFLWKDAVATNGLNLNLDYEAVYNKAAEADYWINTGFAASLAEIKSADKKNAFFRAFKSGKVYNNNLRNTPSGGFDFWESGVVYPDKILADLIYILHTDVLPNHQLYYYKKLN